MRYHVKPYSVPNSKARREVKLTSDPKPEAAFTIDAVTENEMRAALRERYKRLGRKLRSINHLGPDKLVVYVEAK